MVIVAVGYSETQEYNDRVEPTSTEYSSNSRYQPRNSYHYRNNSRENNYWDAEQKQTKMYCTNCGIRIDANDIFCSSCGWRVS